MQGSHTHIPGTNHVPRGYNVAAILSLLFMVPLCLVPALAVLFFYVSTFRNMCAVLNMAVFCSSLTSWFPGRSLLLLLLLLLLRTGFWWGNLRERGNWGDPDADGRIILRWIFRKWEGGCGDWMGLAQDRDRWRALVSTVMNLRVPKNEGNFLTSCRTT